MSLAAAMRVLRLDPRDNALVALDDLAAGEHVRADGFDGVLPARVPAKHKFATAALAPGDAVYLYGVLVGRARAAVATGGLLTTANLAHDAAPFSERRGPHPPWSPPDVGAWRERTFLGYHRPGGRVGTRNIWLVAPLVFCENRNVQELARAFEDLGYTAPARRRRQVARLAELYRRGELRNRAAHAGSELDGAVALESLSASNPAPLFDNVDAIRFITHTAGCGGTPEDAANLCSLLAAYICHPNVAGATVFSLGCQQSQVGALMAEIRRRDPDFAKPFVLLDQQRTGGLDALMDRAVRETFLGMAEANRARRAPAPLSALTVGLKCGGSDGFSGISANPALGHVSDVLTTLGGATVLSEFPELCGVEQDLIDRCSSDEAAARFAALMRDYAARAHAAGAGFENNPSPGNIRDGLITDAMKSAGAARKGGRSPVNAVLDYLDPVSAPGLNLLCTPGNDVECVTAQVASGATLVLFTTGLGTPTGNPVAPVVKISSNSVLARRMPDIIDFDSGQVITGAASVAAMGEQLLDRVVAVASGARVAAERHDQADFIPWKRGVSL